MAQTRVSRKNYLTYVTIMFVLPNRLQFVLIASSLFLTKDVVMRRKKPIS